MTRYSVQPRDQILIKGYGFLSFAKNMGKHVGKKYMQVLNSKYSQNLLDHAIQSAIYALKTLQKKQFKKQHKQLVIRLLIKLLIK